MANQRHLEGLLAGKEAWNARRDDYGDLADIDPDFSGSDIRDLFETTLNLNHLDDQTPLSGYNLVGSDFTDAVLWNANLEQAELAVAQFVRTNLIRADLTGSDCEEADFSGARLWSANLTDANLSRANLTNAELRNVTFENTNLVRANLAGVDLTGSSIAEAKLFLNNDSPEQFSDVNTSAESLEDVLNIVRTIRTRYEDLGVELRYYFRGESENIWPLQPSAMRDPILAASESAMLTELMTRRPDEFNTYGPAVGQWMIAQHHGLKTRFLDISSNPLVSLFHATTPLPSDEDDESDSTGGLFRIFATPPNLVKAFNSDTISIIANFAKLTSSEQAALSGNQKNQSFDAPSYSAAMERLCQLIQSEKPYFAPRIDPRDFYRVCVVEPQRSSERIRAQSGAFLLSAFHQTFERSVILDRNNGIPIYAHYSVTIPKARKSDIRKDLRLLNITHETLFPGLDASAAAITDNYKPTS